MSLTFKLDASEFEKAAKELKKALGDTGGAAVLLETGELLAGYIRAEMENSPATGGTYKVSKSGPLHSASAPGEPPAVDTGNLVNSIRAEKHGAFIVRVGTGVFYAPFLEFGTRKMAARPFIRPTFDKRQSDLIAFMVKQIAKAIT